MGQLSYGNSQAKSAALPHLSMSTASLRVSVLLGLLLTGVGYAPPGRATELVPFHSADANPFVQIFGLPALGVARVLPAGGNELSAIVTVANGFTADSNATESARLDGEIRRIALVGRRGVGNGFDWGIELPHVAHGGGQLDNLIEQWHELFGLPTGSREAAPRNDFEYLYQRNGTDAFHMTEPASGWGDLRLTAGYQLPAATTDLALRASLKLPTGDSTVLLGSGGTDLALWLTAACGSSCGDAWGWYGGGGLLILGQGEVLPAQQRRLVGFAAAGLAYRLVPALTLKSQIDAHTDFYGQTDLPEIGAASAQLLIGGALTLGERYTLDFAVGEELVHNTAADLVLLVSLRTTF
jgi:hypothetical protein